MAVGNPEYAQRPVRSTDGLARDGPERGRHSTVVGEPRNPPFGVLVDETVGREFAEGSHGPVRRAETPPGLVVESGTPRMIGGTVEPVRLVGEVGAVGAPLDRPGGPSRR